MKKKNTTILGFVLFIVSLITVPAFSVLGIIYSIFRFWDFNDSGKYFKNIAISLDQLGNVSLQYFFNDVMINKQSAHKFGNPDETISSVFGKNQIDDTLTIFGKFWNRFLNNLEENHSINSIEEDEN